MSVGVSSMGCHGHRRLVLAGNSMASNTFSLTWQLVVNVALGLGGELFLVNNFGDEAVISPAYVVHCQLPSHH